MNRLENQKMGIVTFTTTGWLVSLGLFENNNIPNYLIPLLLLGILSIGSSLYYSNVYQYKRCHTYIQVFIEGRVPWLHWETLSEDFSRTILNSRKLSFLKSPLGKVARVMTFWLMCFFLVTLFLAIIQVINVWKAQSFWTVFFYVLSLAVFMIAVSQVLYRIWKLRDREFIDVWLVLYSKCYGDQP